MQRPMSVELVNEYGRHTVRIAIDESAVLLDPSDVDAVIRHLSYLRAAMRPEIEKEPSRMHQYVIEMDPCWHSEKHPLYDGAVLILRHSGLGWAGFALPTQSMQKLRDVLTEHLEALAEEHCLPN
ncbi:hypothetical protein G3N95_17445 [Paraburkholderia sp. Tr-20389]|uniref:hypothetical protein n=1 Tax=Paraburkholderia sp. Tr-20389 TaxID=2703903 RepID=UPI001980F9F1|nr:hypothetical protein [Paraburkholderia sp. Tr-20389]MBN3754737.1 hypothetical protein [Paraburkholderia sp. Tr-20389]